MAKAGEIADQRPGLLRSAGRVGLDEAGEQTSASADASYTVSRGMTCSRMP